MSDENKGFAFVKCCERNKNYIYLTYDDDLFNIDDEAGMMSSNIEYCPWCGILLDTNLCDNQEDCHPLNISNDDLIRAWNYGDASYSRKMNK